MKYHPAQQTVRISYAGTKRLYLFEKSWNSKLLIRNEYGVEVGRIIYDKWYHLSGTIEIDEKKFHYTSGNGEPDNLIVYDQDKNSPLITCDLKTDKASLQKPTSINMGQAHAAFILSLSRYLLQPELVPEKLERIVA